MSRLGSRDLRALKEILATLVRSVEVWAFLQDDSTSQELTDILSDVVRLAAGKVIVRSYGLGDGQGLGAVAGVSRRPALRVAGPNGELLPIEISGAPTGYQFGVFIGLLVAASRGRGRLPRSLTMMAKNFPDNLLLDVAVLPTCPHSPQVVRCAQDFAMANPGRIFARSVDITQDSDLANTIDQVPLLTVTINGRVIHRHVGMVSAGEFGQLIQASEKEARRHYSSTRHN